MQKKGELVSFRPDIKIVDCTLRDGGYANDWRFGRKSIVKIKEALEESNIDIIELGFMRDEPYDPDRSIFSRMEDVNELLSYKKQRLKSGFHRHMLHIPYL